MLRYTLYTSLMLYLQLTVLKYVTNKDVFMKYHKAHLTRRLILDTSADNEKEENMVEWLRVRHSLFVGHKSTTRGVLTDVAQEISNKRVFCGQLLNTKSYLVVGSWHACRLCK